MGILGSARKRRFWTLILLAGVMLTYMLSGYLTGRGQEPVPSERALGLALDQKGGAVFVSKVFPKDKSGKPTAAFAGGVQEGDRILALSSTGGPRLTLRNDREARQALQVVRYGKPFVLVVERGGGENPPAEVELQIPATPAPPKLVAGLSLPFALMVYGLPLICIVTGLCIGLLKLEDAGAFTAAMLFFCFARLKGDPAALPPGFREAAFMLGSFLFSAWSYFFMRFFLIFPSPSPLDKRFPWLKKVLISFAVAFTLWNFMWEYVGQVSFTAQAAMVHYFRWFDMILDAVFVAMFALGFLSLGLNLATTKDLDDRRRLRILLVGSLGVLPTLVNYVGVAIVGRMPALPSWAIIVQWAALAMFPVAFGYVVVKHRVFGIRVILRRGLQYALLSRGFLIFEGVVLFLLLFYGSGPLLGQLLEGTSTSTLAIVMALITVLATVGLKRLNAVVMHALDRRFFRETYDGKRILTDLGRDVERLATEPVSLAQMVVEKIMDSLHPDVVALFLRGSDLAKLPQLGETGKKLPGKAILAQSSDFYGFWMRVRSREAPAGGPAESAASLEVVPPSFLLARQLEGMEDQEPYALEVYLDDPKSWAAEILDEAPFNRDCAAEKELLERCHTRLIVPLVAHKRVIGFLSLGEKRSEEPYSKEDRELLVSVAQQVAVAFAYAGFIREEAEQLNLRHDIEIAQKVQERLLPQTKPPARGLDYLGACKPAFGVGGDCYDFVDLGQERVGFALGDVSGKGIAAALLMASVQAMLRIHADTHGQEVHRLAGDINKHLCTLTDAQRFVTFFYGVYDAAAGLFSYVNAGHNPPMLLRPAGGKSVGAQALRDKSVTGPEARVDKLMPTGMVMGVVPEAKYTKETVSLLPGDLLVVYTDGITEAMNQAGDEYGEDRLEALVRSKADLSPEGIRAAVFEDVKTFLGDSPQNDDITLVVAKMV